MGKNPSWNVLNDADSLPEIAQTTIYHSNDHYCLAVARSTVVGPSLMVINSLMSYCGFAEIVHCPLSPLSVLLVAKMRL